MNNFETIKNSKIINIFILILLVLALPLAGLLLYGYAEGNGDWLILAVLAYLGALGFFIARVIKQKFFKIILIFVAVFVAIFLVSLGVRMFGTDSFCSDYRESPYCVEDTCGFTCSTPDHRKWRSNYVCMGPIEKISTDSYNNKVRQCEASPNFVKDGDL